MYLQFLFKALHTPLGSNLLINPAFPASHTLVPTLADIHQYCCAYQRSRQERQSHFQERMLCVVHEWMRCYNVIISTLAHIGSI